MSNDEVEALVTLTLSARVNLGGMEQEDYRSGLQARLDRAVGDGLITGYSPATVDEWSTELSVCDTQERNLDHRQVEEWFKDQIESGCVRAEDLPRMLARYAFMQPAEVRAELAERIQVA